MLLHVFNVVAVVVATYTTTAAACWKPRSDRASPAERLRMTACAIVNRL